MSASSKTSPRASAPDPLKSWRLALWMVFAGGAFLILPQCVDYSLAPRFFFLSAALAVSFYLLWKDMLEHGDWRLTLLDGLLLGWYGLNLASVSWAFSRSEGWFYAQKTLLLLLTYWLLRQAFRRDEANTLNVLRSIMTWLGWLVCGITTVQLTLAFSQYGLDNEKLYDAVNGMYGNKSLTSEFLFFILAFHLLLHRDRPRGRAWWALATLLGLLLLLLQTRTVYLAVGVCGVLYVVIRALREPGFRKPFFRYWLPAGVLGGAALFALLAWKGSGSSLTERLNPMTYLGSQSANERRFVWYKTGLLNEEHVWLGVGDGSWKFWFPSKNIQGGYRLAERNVVFTRVHNDYLEIRSELGLVGLALFCAIFLAAFRLSWRGDPEVGLVLLGYCIIQFFDFPRERIDMQVMLALILAWISFYSEKAAARERAGIAPGLKKLLPILLAAGLAFSLTIGWYRIRGEIQQVKMVEAQVKKNWKSLAALAVAAENPFFEYTEVALPLAWHEGVAYYQMGQTQAAVQAFDKAYRLNPWSFQVLNNYASALVKADMMQQAASFYEQALTINPAFDDGKLNLCFVYYKLGDYPRAWQWLDKVDTIPNPGNDVDRESNRKINARKADFKKVLEEKLK